MVYYNDITSYYRYAYIPSTGVTIVRPKQAYRAVDIKIRPATFSGTDDVKVITLNYLSELKVRDYVKYKNVPGKILRGMIQPPFLTMASDDYATEIKAAVTPPENNSRYHVLLNNGQRVWALRTELSVASKEIEAIRQIRNDHYKERAVRYPELPPQHVDPKDELVENNFN